MPSVSEQTKLKDCEYPLLARILHGPCEKIVKIFLMEADLSEEVPHDVSGKKAEILLHREGLGGKERTPQDSEGDLGGSPPSQHGLDPLCQIRGQKNRDLGEPSPALFLISKPLFLHWIMLLLSSC